MGLSNLPPGVTPSMIPGDRPEDVAWEKMLEWIDTMAQFMIVEPEEIKQVLTQHYSKKKGWLRFMIELKKNREAR